MMLARGKEMSRPTSKFHSFHGNETCYIRKMDLSLIWVIILKTNRNTRKGLVGIRLKTEGKEHVNI